MDFERLKEQAIPISILLGLAIIIGAAYPRHANFRLAWGFPFEYRFILKTESLYPGIVEIGPKEGFSFFFLILNIWLLFFVFVILLYILGPFLRELKRTWLS